MSTNAQQSSTPLSPDAALQREYYSRTAADYEIAQFHDGDEHFIALGWMAAMIAQRGYATVLDIGSGTGRVLHFLNQHSKVKVTGIEPSADLRAIGYANGLSADQLITGDALALPFADNSFDVVCSYGVLHHIKDHQRAVSEMTRVASRAVFISDSNNFGQGSKASRMLKQVINAFGLWQVFDWLRTRGKGYHFSEGDGVFYSYSLFNDVPVMEAKFKKSLFMSTRPSGGNLYRSADTVAILASND
jgi:ubiquinone/menaquinone biosynthesis C-methylase UbiE